MQPASAAVEGWLGLSSYFGGIGPGTTGLNPLTVVVIDENFEKGY